MVPRDWAEADCVPPHDLTGQPAVLPTGPAMGTLPDDHPLCGDFVSGSNAAHASLFAEADVVLAAGAHLGFNSTSYWKVPLARLIHLNIEADVIGRSYGL